MKRLRLYATLILSTFILGNAFAQERYLDEVFNDVTVTTDIQYGMNATVIAFGIFGEAIPQALTMDVYEPTGDTETSRPLVIYTHTGNFLPHPDNLSPSGTKSDSTCVAICTRLAKMGYVVASIDYRLGWNPIAPTQDERVNTLINAAYRGVQDNRTAARFFRKNADQGGNTYGIDPNKIVTFGQGTGGYISLASATLDAYSKILIPKFITIVMGNPVPMVIEFINGDINGTSYGIVPTGIGAPNPGDTMCYPNHVGYSSDFQLAVNLGGAMGDTSWLDPGDIPIVSLQVPSDPFAPYTEGIVIVPGVNLPVVEVQGSYVVQQLANAYGNHDAWIDEAWTDPFTMRANLENDGYEGLNPLLRNSNPLDSSPWDFWAPDNVNNASGLVTNPDMSAVKAHTYIDTILGYYGRRACIALDLGCTIVSVPEITKTEVGLNIGPNPSSDVITLKTAADYPIQSVYVYDINGKLVKARTEINSSEYRIEKSKLVAGMYFAEVRFEEGKLTERIIFE